MKTFAPGKIVLTGAYAVLEGAPAIVLATSRGAFADSARVAPTPTPEVRAALGDAPAPHVDASALFVGGRKLGLGASAAILVASLAAREADRGADLSAPLVRDAIFARARAAHAVVQEGGSGIDVAASVFGGALRYVMGEAPARIALPPGVRVSVLACGTSARTSELRAHVAAAGEAVYHTYIAALSEIARDASDAIASADGARLVDAVRRAARALDRLGKATSAPIVPDGFAALEALAAEERAALCVSGAGGGDVAVFVGSAPPSRTFLDRAHALGLFPLDVDLDEKGVRIARDATETRAASSSLRP